MWLASLVLVAAAGATPPPMSNHTEISNPWFRALPARLPAGGYLELHNTGRWLSTLTGADSPHCGMLMLHKSEQKSGMDTMSDMASLDIPAGETVKFAPGGYHLMCTDPGPTMKPGNTVPVRLHFSDGSARIVAFSVKNARGQ
ncbi:MAG: copper chaperone PCu(A)C [Alphaproteobacteria bacterium]|nr:copper chaperone PCu(A)C [Alphaproteobacteria bacterium]